MFFDSQSKKIISISTWSIVKTLLLILVFVFLYILRDIIGLVFVAIFLAMALIPIVNWLQKKGIPRFLSIIIIYAGFLVMFSVVIGFLIPPIYTQFSDIASRFPSYYDQFMTGFAKIQGSNDDSANLSQNLKEWLAAVSGQAGNGIISVVSDLFGGLFFFIVVLVIIFYLTMEEKVIEKITEFIVPIKYQKDVITISNRVQTKLGSWLQGQFILGGIIAVLTFILLLPVMPKYALILALFAGMTEFIPYVGPFLSAVPAIFLAFSFGSWFTVIYITVVYLIIQQTENNFIVPQVMKKMVDINPIVSIVMIMVGARLGKQFLDIGAFGSVVGIFLAIPLTITIMEIIKYLKEKRGERKATENQEQM